MTGSPDNSLIDRASPAYRRAVQMAAGKARGPEGVVRFRGLGYGVTRDDKGSIVVRYTLDCGQAIDVCLSPSLSRTLAWDILGQLPAREVGK